MLCEGQGGYVAAPRPVIEPVTCRLQTETVAYQGFHFWRYKFN